MEPALKKIGGGSARSAFDLFD